MTILHTLIQKLEAVAYTWLLCSGCSCLQFVFEVSATVVVASTSALMQTATHSQFMPLISYLDDTSDLAEQGTYTGRDVIGIR